MPSASSPRPQALTSHSSTCTPARRSAVGALRRGGWGHRTPPSRCPTPTTTTSWRPSSSPAATSSRTAPSRHHREDTTPGRTGPAPAGPVRPGVVSSRWWRDGAVLELVAAGELEGRQEVVVVGVGHREGGVRCPQPPRRSAPTALLLAGVHVLECEVSACGLGDDADGIHRSEASELIRVHSALCAAATRPPATARRCALGPLPLTVERDDEPLRDHPLIETRRPQAQPTPAPPSGMSERSGEHTARGGATPRLRGCPRPVHRR